MKTKLIPLIALCTLVSFAASALFWKMAPKESFKSFPSGIFKIYNQNSQTEREKIYFQSKEKNVKKIKIMTAVFNIEVGQSSSDQVEIDGVATVENEVTGKQSKRLSAADVFKISRSEDGTLKINLLNGFDEKSKSGLVGLILMNSIAADGKLKLKLPASVQEVEIVSVSGDISVEKAKLEKLKIEAVSSEINIQGSELKNFKHASVSGRLIFEGSLEHLKSTTTSSDLSLKLKNFSPDLKIQTISGDTKIEFKDQPDVQIKFSSISGNFNSKYNVKESGNTKTVGKGEGSIKYESTSGSLEL